MILGLLTILIMLGVAYAFFREGVLTAATTCVNVVIAGLVAFNFFEPLARELEPLLTGSFLQGYEDSLCLMVLFGLTLGLLRLAVNNLSNVEPESTALLKQGGAALFGLLTGYLASGFLVCVLQTLPWHEHFLGFDSAVDLKSPGEKARRFMPPDRVWLALLQFGSRGGLGRGDEGIFDKNGTFELRYQRFRRSADNRDPLPDQGEAPARDPEGVPP
jgi:hypothetical protein